MSYPDFIPPYDEEVEACVLGTIITEREAYSKTEAYLTEDCFYNPFHRVLYNAIVELTQKSRRPDANTVRSFLNEKKIEFDVLVFVKIATSFTFDLETYCLVLKEKYAQRRTIEICRENIDKVNKGEDIGDVLFGFDKDLGGMQEFMVGKSETEHISSAVKGALEQMYVRMDDFTHDRFTGVNTGLVDLNKRTNGWQSSELIIIAARPAMGKTALALKFAKSAGVPVAMFSLEMSDVSLANRMLLSETNIHPDDFKRGRLTPEQAQEVEIAAGRVCKFPIYIDSNASVSMKYIHTKCRTLHKKGRCGLVIIDYLQLAQERGEKNRNREQEIANMSREAKIIAKELDVPVLLLSQMSRDIEKRTDKRPMLSDLRESGAIEQDADMVIFVHRPEYYHIEVSNSDGGIEENYGELIIAKYRNGGIGVVKFKHNGSLTKIFDYYPSVAPLNYSAVEHYNEPKDNLPF